MYAQKCYREGELILCCEPIAVGPSNNVKKRICIACLRSTKNSTTCYQCEWPLCDVGCPKLQYHQMAECEIFRNLLSKYATSDERNSLHQYGCILPLRLLLLKEDDPVKWNKVTSMKVSKFVDMHSTRIEKNIVRYIRTICKLTKYSEDLILDICEIIQKHGVVFNLGNQNVVCLYENVSNISHRCIANAVYNILPSEDYRIFIRAAVPIQQDEQVYISKVNPLYPTLLRKKILISEKMTVCDCQRCEDQFELGTHMSCVKCFRCASGYISGANSSTTHDADWRCVKCKYFCPFKKIVSAHNSAIKEIKIVEQQDNIRGYYSQFKKLIEYYSHKLHPTHGLVVYMKVFGLLSQFNNEFSVSPEFSDVEIASELDLAKSTLKILDVITPGYTVQRCGLIYVIHKLMLTLALNLRRKKEITKLQFDKDVKSAMRFGRLACEISAALFPRLTDEITSDDLATGSMNEFDVTNATENSVIDDVVMSET